MPRPVLITGAFGHLGSKITARLVARGEPVVALDLDTPLVRAKAERLGVAPTFVDLTDAAAVRSLVQRTNPRAVLHVAAVIPPMAYGIPAVAERVNVDGTRHLVEALRHVGSDARLVFASSISVYGSRNGAKELGLLTADSPLRPAELYGESKARAEEIVRTSGLRWTILRLSGLIGAEIVKKVNSHMMFMEAIVPSDNRLHTIGFDDCADAFVAAIEADCDGAVLNVGGDESHMHRQSDFARDIMWVSGLKVPQHKVWGRPGNPADDGAWFYTDWLDVAPTFALLGIRPKSWEETIRGARKELSVLRRPLAPLGRLTPRLLERRSPYRFLDSQYADPYGAIVTKYGAAALGAVAPLAV